MAQQTPTNTAKKLLLASPRGFCAGVKRAINTLNLVIENYPKQTIYCYHQVVHNTHVVKEFEGKGVIFVDSLDEVPNQAILIFSSHGVSPEIKQKANNKHLEVFDVTCPYVQKTHLEVKRYAQKGYQIIYLGQKNHDEAVGTTNEAPDKTIIIQTEEEATAINVIDPKKIALVTQTTLSFDETGKIRQILKQRFPNLIEPLKSDICMATQNRQNGVKKIIKEGAEIVIVLGSKNSSNSNKLKKVAESLGVNAYLLDNIQELDFSTLSGMTYFGLTAGASLPEYKVAEAINWFKDHGIKDVEEIVVADESKDTFLPVKVS